MQVGYQTPTSICLLFLTNCQFTLFLGGGDESQINTNDDSGLVFTDHFPMKDPVMWEGFQRSTTEADSYHRYSGKCKGCGAVLLGVRSTMASHKAKCSKWANLWGSGPGRRSSEADEDAGETQDNGEAFDGDSNDSIEEVPAEERRVTVIESEPLVDDDPITRPGASSNSNGKHTIRLSSLVIDNLHWHLSLAFRSVWEESYSPPETY